MFIFNLTWILIYCPCFGRCLRNAPQGVLFHCLRWVELTCWKYFKSFCIYSKIRLFVFPKSFNKLDCIIGLLTWAGKTPHLATILQSSIGLQYRSRSDGGSHNQEIILRLHWRRPSSAPMPPSVTWFSVVYGPTLHLSVWWESPSRCGNRQGCSIISLIWFLPTFPYEPTPPCLTWLCYLIPNCGLLGK